MGEDGLWGGMSYVGASYLSGVTRWGLGERERATSSCAFHGAVQQAL